MKFQTPNLLALLICAATPLVAQAQSEAGDAFAPSSAPIADRSHRERRIEGLWDEQVTIKDCGTGATLMVTRGTNLFSRGGALVATNNAPPASMGPALGEWWHESHGIYFGAKMRLNRFNPDGSFAGIREIEREITLDNHAESLTGTVNSKDYDPAGNLIHTICAVETGNRVPSP